MKILNTIFILSALIILGVSLYNANKTGENMVEQHQEQDVDKPSNGEENIGREVLPTHNEVRQNVSNEEIQAYIQEVFGDSADWGLGVAFCESRFNPDDKFSNGLYFGLFQFSHSTFNRNCDGSIWEWKDQVVCAKKLYEKGEATRKQNWPNCP